MIKNAFRLFLLFIGFAFTTQSQSSGQLAKGAVDDTVKVNSLLQQSKDHAADAPEMTITLAKQAKALADRLNYLKGQAYALKNIGLGYYYQGKYIEALDYWNQSLKVFETIQDDIGVANLLNNIAVIYTEQGDEERGLDYSLRSLKLSEKSGDKLRILSALNTVGSIYYRKEATYGKALNYLLQALPLSEAIGDKEVFGIISENIGEIYFYKNDDAKAVSYFKQSIKAISDAPNTSFAYNGLGKLYLKQDNPNLALTYHEKALEISERLNSQPNVIRSLEGIANVYVKLNDYPTALKYYHKARIIAEEIKANVDLKEIYQEMADTYSKTSDYKNAFIYKTLYAVTKDTLYNIETEKKLNTLQFDFDLEKKQGEINLLTKDNALNELQIKRQKLVKNAFAGGLALVMMIAVIIFRNYREKVKTNKMLDQQKDEIEGLLLNILPAEVAKELQVNGQATPRNFESVSVMFTDFKSFTVIADKMSPQDLVEELNTCFKAFDHIIGKYNLEKIKTIGDAYMCAGGIPSPDDRHAHNMVKASLEIQEYIKQNNKRKVEEGKEAWDLRLGLHVGPIVAGVVGKKKYAYDIWGSTVNVASRMESNGEPGRVNISAATYELIKDEFECSYRGKIYAKNVGEIDMYFVDAVLNNSDSNNYSQNNLSSQN
jgi:class 3 adenylate cyclase/tetratricopeptide (TPR) repeat protein